MQYSEQDVEIEKLCAALSTMFRTRIVSAECHATRLHGGTLGDVRLLEGTAEDASGGKLPYKLVLKMQKKWERYGDPGSWRREYDLYASDLGELLTGSLRWPKLYLADMEDDSWQMWMEHIDGVSGTDLTDGMYERAAEELGRFQGKLHAARPDALSRLTNLSGADAMKNFYLYYRSWSRVFDYVRSEDCEIPKHLREMIVSADETADETWRRIEELPIVFCHRDFWVENIFCSGDGIVLIDWDTAGWGYLGEDIISLIADEADVEHMVEYYRTCVEAYRRGFSEYSDISHIADLFIRERIILHFGYRIVEWYLDAESADDKALQVATLQKIFEMADASYAKSVESAPSIESSAEKKLRINNP
jgi:Ser/Thr protein kinase RdoA (MazF antagonist)